MEKYSARKHLKQLIESNGKCELPGKWCNDDDCILRRTKLGCTPLSACYINAKHLYKKYNFIKDKFKYILEKHNE